MVHCKGRVHETSGAVTDKLRGPDHAAANWLRVKFYRDNPNRGSDFNTTFLIIPVSVAISSANVLEKTLQ